MTTVTLPILHARASPFSYRCHACRRCCHGKRIQVNPYELARLARRLGTTTTDVIARFTVDGTALATRADSSCVFLDESGCSVHADRPLVCRLYPLGRIVHPDGSETFVENAPHPESAGEYGHDGTVAEYLDAQDVHPYLHAADRYYAVLTKLLSRDTTEDASSGGSELPFPDPGLFIDADLAVGTEAARTGTNVPEGADALIALHLELIDRWVPSPDGPTV